MSGAAILRIRRRTQLSARSSARALRWPRPASAQKGGGPDPRSENHVVADEQKDAVARAVSWLLGQTPTRVAGRIIRGDGW